LRVAGETLALAVKVRETADCDAPARRATSIDEAYFLATDTDAPSLPARRFRPALAAGFLRGDPARGRSSPFWLTAGLLVPAFFSRPPIFRRWAPFA
jgi:hypothetical protein